MNKWSRWHAFPDPSAGGYLHAPFGAGVYELMNRATGERVLVGKSVHAAERMSSLLPAPVGCGGRSNLGKRRYVEENLASIWYRTMACESDRVAREVESRCKRANKYVFPE